MNGAEKESSSLIRTAFQSIFPSPLLLVKSPLPFSNIPTTCLDSTQQTSQACLSKLDPGRNPSASLPNAASQLPPSSSTSISKDFASTANQLLPPLIASNSPLRKYCLLKKSQWSWAARLFMGITFLYTHLYSPLCIYMCVYI